MSCPPDHGAPCVLRAVRARLRRVLRVNGRELDDALLAHLAGAPRLRLAVAHEAARRRLWARA